MDHTKTGEHMGTRTFFTPSRRDIEGNCFIGDRGAAIAALKDAELHQEPQPRYPISQTLGQSTHSGSLNNVGSNTLIHANDAQDRRLRLRPLLSPLLKLTRIFGILP